jgi:hypothetical protein
LTKYATQNPNNNSLICMIASDLLETPNHHDDLVVIVGDHCGFLGLVLAFIASL